MFVLQRWDCQNIRAANLLRLDAPGIDLCCPTLLRYACDDLSLAYDVLKHQTICVIDIRGWIENVRMQMKPILLDPIHRENSRRLEAHADQSRPLCGELVRRRSTEPVSDCQTWPARVYVEAGLFCGIDRTSWLVVQPSGLSIPAISDKSPESARYCFNEKFDRTVKPNPEAGSAITVTGDG